MTDDDKEPAYMRLVRELATQKGITTQEFLEQDRKRAENSDFPTPDCLTQNEAQELVDAGVALDGETKVNVSEALPPLSSFIELEKLVAHLGQCSFCRILFRAMTPLK